MKKRKKIYLIILFTFLILISSYVLFNIFSYYSSFSNDESAWDGKTVSTSFSFGNGSKENPYLITNGEDFMYFKSLIEESDEYNTFYYKLDNNINMGSHKISGVGTKDNYFKGHFDGNGYTISNVTIDKSSIDNNDYYGLFNYTENAYIYNLNIDTISIDVLSNGDNNIIVGSLVGKIITKSDEDEDKENDKDKDISSINDISINNIRINLSNSINNEDNCIGGLACSIDEHVTIKNIYLGGNIITDYNDNISIIAKSTKSDSTNIINNISKLYDNYLESDDTKHTNIYIAKDNDNYTLNDKNISIDKIIDKFNKDNDYTWEFVDVFRLKEPVKAASIVPNNSVQHSFSFSINGNINLHASGVDGSTLYVNDLDADEAYYSGLNYTDYRDLHTLPTGDNRNLYNSSNLVKVYIRYSGIDFIDDNTIGYVSLTEQIDTIIYYKYYVVENGYVTIDLIDNPWADRPNNKVFNGWMTDDNDLEITIDMDTYVRQIKVPVSNTSNIININLMSSWIEGNVQYVSNGLSTAMSNFYNKEFHALTNIILDPSIDITDYYIRDTVDSNEYYPSGAYSSNGQSVGGTRCRPQGWNTTCTYYIAATEYIRGTQYYRRNNNNFQTVNLSQYEIETNRMTAGTPTGGFYKKNHINNGANYSNMYNASFVYGSGTCRTSGGCDLYEYQTYLDGNGNENVADGNTIYYYLVTRDTNILVADSNITTNISTTKPMTITGVNNGTNNNSRIYLLGTNNTYITAGDDLRIEYITLYTTTNPSNDDNTTSSNSTNGNIYGGFNNVKMGRGILNNGNYVGALGIFGGNNSGTGSSGNPTRYTFIVESGYYGRMIVTGGSGTDYVDAYAIYGNDLDRINENNTNLRVYFAASGSWGATIHSGNDSDPGQHTTVKSGSFGTGKHNYSAGIYVGGRGGGTSYCPRECIIEGGYIYNLIGGPLTASSRSTINDSYINIKGGSIDIVVGGAGASTTYGNRIINMTGGTVNYAIFGGSNGATGSDSGNYQGVLTGSTFVYVGGGHVGGGTGTLTDVYDGEAGSVFGAGNGNSSSTKVGTVTNSKVMITGGTIDASVYGGGNYGAIGTDLSNGSTATSTVKVTGGTITGSVYGGGNNNGAGAYARTSTYGSTYKTVNGNVTIDVTGGTIGNVYGGSRASGKIYGSTTVNVTGGTVTTDVYGGGEGNNTDVRDSVSVTIGSSSTIPRINGSVYGGSAYGTVNSTNSAAINSCPTTTQTVTVKVDSGTIVGSVYGGAKGSAQYTPRVCGDVTVTVNAGSIGSVYGGNNVSGSPSKNDTVYLKGGTIGDAFGGGNSTGQGSTNIYLQGSSVQNLYGGSNSSGNVTTTHVTVTSGSVNNIYGGNNLGGEASQTNVTVTGGNIRGTIYGGGKQADSGDTVVNINAAVHDVFGGGAEADCDSTEINFSGGSAHYIFGGSDTSGTVGASEVNFSNGQATRIYGGNNAGGSTTTSQVNLSGGSVTDTFGGGDRASTGTSNISITGGSSTNVYGGGNNAGVTNTYITMTDGSVTSMYGGSNASGNVTATHITLGTSGTTSNLSLVDLYGGNNLGGTTGSTSVTTYSGTITNIYGGGKQATVTGNTTLDLNGSRLNANVYGGGDQGAVGGNTTVNITDCTIAGSAYAGGNGSSATVTGNTTITIDGATTIGSANGAVPATGSVFGGGNAAETGNSTNNNSVATVNIVGGTIYGNVYGGANTSVIYGSTDVNIGTSAVSGGSNLSESDLIIHGTVFGGGEANASGSDVYDWTFISVTDSIDIRIDGSNYSTNNHQFNLNGSIFGSGNASTSTNPGEIYIKNLGTMSDVSKNVSIQRAGLVTIDNSVIELSGIKDSTNDYSDIPYTFNQIDKLIIKNNTTLLLHKNANLLKEFYSGVDVNGTLVKADVDIDDENKTVTKNVDNRIYMIPNNDLNIATNPAATSYGKVTGMTFFGMFNSYNSGNNVYGIYSDSYDYGDSIDGSELIAGGSYVLGLHAANMDITEDGFYTNVFNDGYTEVVTEYIDPTEVGSTGYRWIIGNSVINYSFSLTASKYSTLGTYTLNLMDFAQGDTIFDVLGVNTEGLETGVSLIPGENVPRLAASDDDANKTLGLSMKSETQEWTSYNNTKFLSTSGGTVTGDKNYKTDSVSTSPKLMFYLYHSKNISTNADLGTVVVTMQAAVPRNQIEYDISIVTITIDLYSRVYEYDDAYDASITYGRKYDMPSATDVNVTNKSQFTAYFSIITKPRNFAAFYGQDGDNYHVLTSTYNFPVGTHFTMIDTAAGNNIEYYYYTVDSGKYTAAAQELANEGEITYYLSDFKVMNSTSSNNLYNDTVQNQKYFDSTSGYVYEEFLFIVDMKNTNSTDQVADKSLLFELRDANNDDATQIVLGIRQDLMKYSLYSSNSSVLDLQASMNDQYLYANTAKAIPFTTGVNYQQTENLNSIIDTNYESDAMGINLSLFDNSGNQVSSSNLLGTSLRLDNQDYFVDADGTWRIKLSNKVSNLSKTLYLTSDGTLSPGNYTLSMTLFSSSDGLHMSSTTGSSTRTFPITVVGNDNALIVSCDDKDKVVIDGKNQLNQNYNVYNITLQNVLLNPNIRLSVLKRNIGTYDTTTYTEVNTANLFNYSFPSYSSGLSAQTTYEKLLSTSTTSPQSFTLPLASTLTTGTYKLVFELYDGNHLIEEDIEYVIVKKTD